MKSLLKKGLLQKDVDLVLFLQILKRIYRFINIKAQTWVSWPVRDLDHEIWQVFCRLFILHVDLILGRQYTCTSDS